MPKVNSRATELKACICCQKLVSTSTAYWHRRLQVPPWLKASSPFICGDAVANPRAPDGNGMVDLEKDLGAEDEISPFIRGDAIAEPRASDNNGTVDFEKDLGADHDDETPTHDHGDPMWTLDCERSDDRLANQAAIIEDALSKLSSGWKKYVTSNGDDDCDDDEESVRTEESDRESTEGSTGLDLQDQLGESFECDLAAIGES